MSTPATIVVHVKKQDVGKIRKCDIMKINLRTRVMAYNLWKSFGMKDEEIKYILSNIDKIPNKVAILDTIKRIKLPEYIEIYHHWDSNPDKLGRELKNKYNSYELALNLCLAGNFSTLLDGSVPYYSIGRKWGNEGPYKKHSVPDNSLDYQYLFDNGCWYYREKGNEKFNKL